MRKQQQPDSLVDTVRSHSASVAAFFEPALPYATQAAASALAFTAGLVATQVRRRRMRRFRRRRFDKHRRFSTSSISFSPSNSFEWLFFCLFYVHASLLDDVIYAPARN